MRYRKFKADQLFTGRDFAPGGSILITDPTGRIETILPESEAGEDIEPLQGILCPGLINCHCHLELSHLKNSIPPGTGMVPFLLAVMGQRTAREEIIQDAIADAESTMLASGIVAVGDICNTAATTEQKSMGRMTYHNFIEVSGFAGAAADTRFRNAIELQKQLAATGPSTIVPHAPYSVSPELFKLINDHAQGQILSMHNQESAEENDFFLTGRSDFRTLYKAIGLELDFFTPPHLTSLQYVASFLQKPQQLLLVHNVVTSQADLDLLSQPSETGSFPATHFCLCPNANQYISHTLPPVDLFLENKCSIVLGTDSLASNYQLSITEEMKTLQAAFPALAIEQLLAWATVNGANALGISDQFGSFEKGKTPGIVCIGTGNNNGRTVFTNSTRLL